MGETGESMEVFRNAFTGEEFQQYPNGEAKLYVKGSKGNLYTNMEELAIAGELDNIQLGFKTLDGVFKPVYSMDTKSDPKTKVIAAGIEEGYLHHERTLNEDGTTSMRGKGTDVQDMKIGSQIASHFFKSKAGIHVDVQPDGSFVLDIAPDETIVVDEKGNHKIIKDKDIGDHIDSAQNKKELHEVDIINKLFGSKPLSKKESQVVTQLLSFLKNAGFSIETLDNYSKNYNTKHNQDPDINALADMANKIVAFANGEISIENLTEEVAHIALEAYRNQSEVTEALMEVVNTEEYKEFSEHYSQKYSDRYEGIALEEMVRKEILGKILHKQFLNKMQKQETDNGTVFSALRSVWNKFTAFIKEAFTPYQQKNLTRLNEKIANLVLDNNTEVFEFDSLQPNIYFNSTNSAHSKIESELVKLRHSIQKVYRNILKEPEINRMQLDSIEEGLSDFETISLSHIAVASTLETLNKLQTAGKPSVAQTAAFRNIQDETGKLVAAIAEELRNANLDAEQTKIAQRIINNADTVAQKISQLESKYNKQASEIARETLKEELRNSGATQEVQDEIIASQEESMRDTGLIGKIFGIAPFSKNPLTALLNKIVSKAKSIANREYSDTTSSVLDKIFKNDLVKEFSKLVNPKSYFVISPFNFDQQEADLHAVILEQVKIVDSKTNEKQVLDLLQLGGSFRSVLKDLNLIITAEDYRTASAKINKFSRSQRTSYYTNQRLLDREKMFNDMNISEATQGFLSEMSARNHNITRKHVVNGRPDLSRLTDNEREELARLLVEHRGAKSILDANGEVREGLRRGNYSDLTAKEKQFYAQYKDPAKSLENFSVIVPTMPVEDLPMASRLALDLNRTTMQSIAKGGSGKNFSEFRKEASKNGTTWALQNGKVSLSEQYFESMGDNFYKDVIQEYARDAQDQNVTDLVDIYLELTKTRSEIMKQYQSSKVATEVLSSLMSKDVQQKLIELDEEILQAKNEILLPEAYQNKIADSDAILDFSADFLAQAQGKDIAEFASQHMNDSNKADVKNFRRSLDRLYNNKNARISNKRHLKFFNDAIASKMIDSSMSQDEVVNTLMLEYSKTKVASYMRAYKSQSLKDSLEKVANGTINVKDLMDDKDPNLQFEPHFVWNKEALNESELDDNFNPDAAIQLSEKYVSKEFMDRFGISKEDAMKGDVTQMTAQRNKKEFEALQIFYEMNQATNEKYGEKVNPYLRPQYERSTVEKVTGLGIKKIKDTISDGFENRADEMEYGDNVQQSGVKSLPKYGRQRQELNKITQDLMYTMFQNYYHAVQYEQKAAAIPKIEAIMYKMSTSKYYKGGYKNKKIEVSGELSNYYAQAKESMDYLLYGVKQNRRLGINLLGREIDLTPGVNLLMKIVSKGNLLFNPTVAATSTSTAVYNKFLTRITGDTYSAESMSFANRESAKLVLNYLSESGKLNKTSTLYKIGALLEVEDSPIDPLRDSNSSRLKRGLDYNRSGYFMDKVGNIPVAHTLALTEMKDTRLVDGEFITFLNFLTKKKAASPNMKTKAIKAEWAKHKNKSFYEFLDFSERTVKPSQEFESLFGADSNEVFNNLTSRIADSVRQKKQLEDGVIDSNDAPAVMRDVAMKGLMMHRGYFLLMLTRQFRGKQFSFRSGQMEEGYYASAFKTVHKMASASLLQNVPFIKRGLDTSLRDSSMKEVWGETSFQEKMAIKRSALSGAIFTLAALLGKAMLEADDDDDSYLMDFAQLVYTRTVAEAGTQQLTALPYSFKEIIESPMVAKDGIMTLNPISAVGSFGDKDGFGGWLKDVKKATILRRPGQLRGLDEQLQTYRFYNQHNLSFMALDKKPSKKKKD